MDLKTVHVFAGKFHEFKGKSSIFFKKFMNLVKFHEFGKSLCI